MPYTLDFIGGVHMSRKWFLFCLILLAFCLTSCLSHVPVKIVKDDYASKVSNYNNFSYMVENDDKVYFSCIKVEDSHLQYNPPDFDKIDVGIYVMDLSGDNIKKISNTYGRFLQVVNDKIYFNTWLPKKGLYRMNLDGSELELIIEGAWLEFYVYKDAIYYVSDMYQPFRRFDLKTGEITTVIDDFGAIKLIDDDYIYFSYDHEISSYYRMNLETKEIQLLKGTEDIPNRFSYDGTAIYYSTFDAIYRIGLNNTGVDYNGVEEKIVDNIHGGYNLIRNGGFFYYFDLRSSDSVVNTGEIVYDLYCVDEKGRKKELLIKDLDQKVSMYIVGGELYITQIDSNTSLIKGYHRFNLENKTLEALNI